MRGNAGATSLVTASECVGFEERVLFRCDNLGSYRFHLFPGSVTWLACRLLDGFQPSHGWRYYRLSNGGSYVAPQGREYGVHLRRQGGWTAVVSGDVAGLLISAFALGHRFDPVRRADPVSPSVRRLLEFVNQHPEGPVVRHLVATARPLQ